MLLEAIGLHRLADNQVAGDDQAICESRTFPLAHEGEGIHPFVC